MISVTPKHQALWLKAAPITEPYVIPEAATTPRATLRPTHRRKSDGLALSDADEAPKMLVEHVADGE